MPSMHGRHRFILRATAGYAILASAWIVLSDRLLAMMASASDMAWLSIIKGLGFVVVTTALLFKALNSVPLPKEQRTATRLDALMGMAIDTRWPVWVVYLFTITISSLCVAARAMVEPSAQADSLASAFVPVAFALAPMTLSAMAGGLWPGLLSVAIISGGFDLFVIGPHGLSKLPHGGEMMRLSFIMASGVTISIVCEVALRARQQFQVDRYLLDAIVSRSTDAIYVKDHQGRYLFFNEATARFLGKSPADVIGRTDAEVLPGASAEVIGAVDRRVVDIGITADYEEHLKLPDGRELTFLSSKGSVHDLAGNPIGIFGIARDITERKRIERALHLRSSALAAAANAIVITDPTGAIEWTNPAFTALTGYGAQECIGLNVGELLRSGRQGPDFYGELWAAVATGMVWTGELVNRRKDGSLYDELQTITPVTDESGRVGHFVAFKQDITDRKRSEVMQREHSRVLEMIARNAPIGQTLERLINGIEAHSPDMLCSVLLFDENNQCLRHGAAPSLPESYNHAVDGLAIGPSAGSCGTAAYWRRVVEVEDIRTDPLWADFQELVATTPLRACWSSPIFDGAGSLLGTFAVYSLLPGRPTAAHRQLVAAATDTAAVCISNARAHAALRESEQRFSRIFETSPIGICLNRLDDMRYVDVNDAWLKLMGFQRAEVIGCDGCETRMWQRPALRTAFLERLNADRAVRDFGATLRRKSGECFEGLICASVVQIGGEDYLLSTVADHTLQISTQRTLEGRRRHLEEQVAARTEEMRTTLSYLRALIDNLPYYIWLKDTEGHLLAVNRAHAESNGHSVEDIAGKTDFDIWPADRAAAHRAVDAEVIATRRTITYEQPYAHVRGTIWVETLKSPVVDAGGRVIGTVGFARDISDAKALEMERERARQAAENLARTKSEFLANMSHEIRTPLSGVLGLARIGFRATEGHESQAIFARILDSGRLLQGVIDDILDYSKIEAGKLGLESVPVRLDAMIRQVVDLVRPQSDSKGLLLCVDVDPSLPKSCLGDPVRLTQVILNLASNAIKFTQKGQIALSARRDGSELVFAVADSGIGISAEQMGILFRPFEQADSSTTRRFGGTGLGLTITKRLVELMSGRLEVQSQIGVGSTFQVWLPFVAAPDLEVPSSPSESEANWPAGRLTGLRILAAEDGEINRIVLDTLLRNEGAAVTTVTNGREAVDRIEQNGAEEFDLILMDIQMPEMDGYEASRRIQKIAPDLPIIGQTAHALAEDRGRCLQSGMCDYIPKPLDPDKLAAAILRHTHKADSRAGRTPVRNS